MSNYLPVLCCSVTVQAIPEGDQGGLETAALLPPVSLSPAFSQGISQSYKHLKGIDTLHPKPSLSQTLV